jgi:hypothetical protein
VLVSLIAWREASMGDERWERLVACHEVEIRLIQAQTFANMIDLGAAARWMRAIPARACGRASRDPRRNGVSRRQFDRRHAGRCARSGDPLDDRRLA